MTSISRHVSESPELQAWPGVWALGDCSAIPDRRTGGFYPPTAQHAFRQGRIVAENIVAAIRGTDRRIFRFSTIGQLAAIGRRTSRSLWGRGVSLLMGGTQPAFTSAGQKLFDANKPSYGPRAVVAALGNDPQGRCSPLEFPRSIYANGRPFELVQTPLQIVQIFEWTHGFREI